MLLTCHGGDPIRSEPGPVLVADDDDRRLQVTQLHHVLARDRVLADVDDRVLDTPLVEGAVGRVALDT